MTSAATVYAHMCMLINVIRAGAGPRVIMIFGIKGRPLPCNISGGIKVRLCMSDHMSTKKGYSVC